MDLLYLGRNICESKSSKMNPTSLGLVLGPSLLTSDDPDLLLQLKKTMVPLFIAFVENYDELLNESILKELEAERKRILTSAPDRKHEGRKYNPEDKTPLLTPTSNSQSPDAQTLPTSSSQEERKNPPSRSLLCYCLCCCFFCCPFANARVIRTEEKEPPGGNRKEALLHDQGTKT